MIVEVLAAGVALTGGTLAVAWPSRDRLLRRRLRQTVIANLKTGTAFHGVLFEVDARTMVLRNAQAHHPGDETMIPVDGELVIARADVEFLQRP